MKVIILVATHNRSHLISATLDSILAQKHENWECIIVDDFSSDDTRKVIQAFIEKDSRFFYFVKTKKYEKGLSGTRNYGLDLASGRDGEFIQFFDDDDLMHPMKLELQIAPFRKRPELNFTVCRYEKLIQVDNGDGEKVLRTNHKMVFPHLGDAILTGEFKMNSLGPVWRKEFINQFRFDEDLRYAEEWELYTRIGYQFPNNYEVVDEYLFQYRKHINSLTLGDDRNFERRKSSAVSRIKIYNFLTEKKLHTSASIIFLAKTFFIASYNPTFIEKLQKYVNEEKNFSLRLKCFLKIGAFLSGTNKKIINRLATWVQKS